MRFQGPGYSQNTSHAEDVTCSPDTRKNPVEATEHLLQLNMAHQSVHLLARIPGTLKLRCIDLYSIARTNHSEVSAISAM